MLNSKQRAFVNEYLICWNASEAARKAGYSGATAHSAGNRLLRDVDVSGEISRRAEEIAMSASEVLARLATHARTDVSDFLAFDDDGKATVDFGKAHEAGRMGLVKKIKFAADGAVEFELHDAQSALALLGKAHRLFIDRRELTGKDGGELPVLVIAPGLLEQLKQ